MEILQQLGQLEVAPWSGGARQCEQRRESAASTEAEAKETAETEVKEVPKSARWPQCCRTRHPLRLTSRGAVKTLRADGVDACVFYLEYSSSCLEHPFSCRK